MRSGDRLDPSRVHERDRSGTPGPSVSATTDYRSHLARGAPKDPGPLLAGFPAHEARRPGEADGSLRVTRDVSQVVR